MGLAKSQMMEEEEQGWSSQGDRFVCDECVDDDYLKDIVRSAATAESCDFCERSEAEPIAAHFDVVMEPIGEAFYTAYTDPVYVAAYESAEGGYQVATTDTEDAVAGLFGGFFSDDFHEAVAESLADQVPIVCEADPYGMTHSEILRYGWERFVGHVKHYSRYFFSVPDERDRDDRESISPADFLDRLSSMIKDLGLIRDCDAPWFRARVHPADEVVDSALGDPGVRDSDDRGSGELVVTCLSP